MNMQNIMAQANKLKNEMIKINNEIEETNFYGKNGEVEIVIKGNNQVQKVNILNSDILSDKEMLEDMLVLAFNDAINQINNMKNDKMGKYTGGLGGLI